MSEIILRKLWHLGTHEYVFYRFEFEDFCKQYLTKSDLMMLDAGCGTNISSLSQVPSNVYCVGVDISPENVAKSHMKTK